MSSLLLSSVKSRLLSAVGRVLPLTRTQTSFLVETTETKQQLKTPTKPKPYRLIHLRVSDNVSIPAFYYTARLVINYKLVF